MYMQLMEANRKTKMHKSSVKIYNNIANSKSVTKQVKRKRFNDGFLYSHQNRTSKVENSVKKSCFNLQ